MWLVWYLTHHAILSYSSTELMFNMKKPKKRKLVKLRKLPPRQLLHDLFEFDFDTGVLTWKTGCKKGKEAGYLNKQGYRIVGVKVNNVRKEYKVHRLVYYMFTGNPLTNQVIDHIDGDKSNNRLTNLRAVTHRINLQNTVFIRSLGHVPKPDKALAFYA